MANREEQVLCVEVREKGRANAMVSQDVLNPLLLYFNLAIKNSASHGYQEIKLLNKIICFTF